MQTLALGDMTALPLQHDPLFAFTINYAKCATAADVLVGVGDELFIIICLMHEGGIRITYDMAPDGMEFLLAGADHDIGPVAKKPEEGETERADLEYEKLLVAMPWLQHLDDKEAFTTGDEGGADGSGSGGQAGVTGGQEIDDDELLAGLSALERVRADAAQDEDVAGGGDFKPKVRGGKSQIAKTGEGAHAMQGQCTNATATHWARTFAQVTWKATFSEHDPGPSRVLVRSWCHRMQFFFNMCAAAPEGLDILYTPAMIASYVEPTELTALDTADATRALLGRIASIRSIPVLR